MRILKTTWSVVVLMGLVACGVDSEPDTFDQALSHISVKERELGKSPQTRSTALAVGQWVTYLASEQGEPYAIQVAEIIGREGSHFWMRGTSYLDYDDLLSKHVVRVLGTPPTFDNPVPELVQFEVDEVDTGDPFTDEFLRYVLEEEAVDLLNSLAAIDFGELEPHEGKVDVIAGTFDGLFRASHGSEDLGDYTELLHPAVPLRGFVRSEANTTIVELADYGFDGNPWE